MDKGKVWLVGAGPGDIGLFTLKGMNVLNQADVVVYDSLVGQGVLAKVPAERPPDQCRQNEQTGTRCHRNGINQVLLEEALKGQSVLSV